MAKAKKVDFEKSLEELNTIVETMERGDLSLEQALKQFEQGIGLTRDCQTALKQAEQTVQQLTDKAGAELTPFKTEANNDE